jgi:hypothetical protein
MVGYWYAPWNKQLDLPRADGLIRVGWRLSERDKIANYLSRGVPCNFFLGFASCRLCDERLGTRDPTDGEWVWPERLEHYITVHDVTLPDVFISAMERNRWRVPKRADVTAKYDYEDFGCWRQWAAQQLTSPMVPAEVKNQPVNLHERQSSTNVVKSLLRRFMPRSKRRESAI